MAEVELESRIKRLAELLLMVFLYFQLLEQEIDFYANNIYVRVSSFKLANLSTD